MITENLSTLKIHKLTQAQYNRELNNGTLDEAALYLTPDEEISLTKGISVGVKKLMNGETFDAVSKVEVNGLTVTPTVTTYTLPEISVPSVATVSEVKTYLGI